MSDKTQQFRIQLNPVQVQEAVAAYVQAAGMGTATHVGATFQTSAFFPVEIVFTGFEVVVQKPSATVASDAKAKGQ